MTDKEIIEIDGINVLECEHYQYKSLKDCEMRYPESGDCEIGLLNYLFDGNLDMEKLCKDNPNCYYKQLQKEKFENLNNRQMVESAENLIYENSELIKNLEEKKQECEELKKQLMQKSEVDIFFNTPIEGWSSDPCGICKYKNCLTEIKEIAEPFCNACQEFEPKKNDSNCMYCNYGEILQKISECEVNND